MEPSQQIPPSVPDQYLAQFGEEGAFDRALLPEVATLSLMADALRRGSPVTQDDLESMHQTLYRQPMPAEGQAVAPSGLTPPVPDAAADLPAFFTAIPPVPVDEPPVEAPAEEARR
jgi:hypothetical protein